MPNEPMTQEEIARDLALCKAAQEAPSYDRIGPTISDNYLHTQREFAKAARTRWPRALAEVQRLQAEIEQGKESQAKALLRKK